MSLNDTSLDTNGETNITNKNVFKSDDNGVDDTSDGSNDKQLNGVNIVDNKHMNDDSVATNSGQDLMANRKSGNVSYEDVSEEELETNSASEDELESTLSLEEDGRRLKPSRYSLTDDRNDPNTSYGVDQLVSSLPDTVTVLDGPNGAKVYLVGTAHFSEKSQQDVSQTIHMTHPNVVVLELCESRLSILSMNEKTILEESQSMGVQKIRHNIREHGLVQGVMYVLLLSLSAHLTRQLGMAPGGEFRRAFQEASKIPGCIVHLGDRPVHLTLRRAISSLSVWQKLRLAFGIIFNSESISKDEIEKCKQKDLLEEMLSEMTGEFPTLSRVFVEERDTYLAYSLWLASSPLPNMESADGFKPAVVVGVVGIGHMAGIVKKWGTVKDEDIPPLLRIPETSLTTKIVKKSIKYTVIGLAVWAGYRMFVPNSINHALSDASIQTINWIQKSLNK